jgi:hypothetical protein
MSREGRKGGEEKDFIAFVYFAPFGRQIPFSNSEMCDDWQRMGEPNENPRRYKWPWFVLAAVALGIILAIVWMGYAVQRERQEHDFNAPIPTGAK